MLVVSTVEEIAYDAARDAIANQRDRLAGVRARAATLLAAAAVATSFLGAQALEDTKHEPGNPAPVTDKSLELSEGLAIAAFALTAALTVYILFPVRMTTRLNGTQLVQRYVDPGKEPKYMQRDLALHLARHHKKNEPVLKRLMLIFRIAGALLALEIVAWLIDIT